MRAKRQDNLIGRWRIIETDLWDRDYLDMLDPAHITFRAGGRGDFAFGCVHATLGGQPSGKALSFTWTGFDENDDVSGEGFAELQDDGTLEGEISFYNGDEATFKAHRF